MFFAAIAHHYAFSYKPFVTTDHNVPWYRSIRSMFDVSDVRDDVADHVARVGKLKLRIEVLHLKADRKV